eukprot:SAG22_NODE_718_length_7670_cov_11.194690_7_plen_87_part_00
MLNADPGGLRYYLSVYYLRTGLQLPSRDLPELLDNTGPAHPVQRALRRAAAAAALAASGGGGGCSAEAQTTLQLLARPSTVPVARL